MGMPWLSLRMRVAGLSRLENGLDLIAGVQADRLVNNRPLQRMPGCVGQHVDAPQPLHRERFVRILFVVKPSAPASAVRRYPLAAPNSSLSMSCIWFEKIELRVCRKTRPERDQQNGKKEDVAEGQAESQPARELA